MVPVFERFRSDKYGKSAAAGRLLMRELGCASCHRAASRDPAGSKQAPLLSGVGSRIKPAHLLKFIAAPHTTKQGTTMPNLFHGKPKEQAAREVRAIVHYLKSLSKAPPVQSYASIGSRERGAELFHRIGCVACHGPQGPAAPKLTTSKPLGDLQSKYTLDSLSAFLQNPHNTRPAGRMPSLNLSIREAGDIAAFLLPNVPQKSGISFEVYRGAFQKLPDFNKLKPVASGATDVIDVKVTKDRDNFALRFSGVLPISQEGEYTFHTRSDDGSKLYVNGKLVVDNDGVHPEVSRSGKIKLKPGKYSLVVEFFEAGGGEAIRAEFEGPGIKRQLVAPSLMAGQPERPLENLAFAVEAPLVSRGRELFRSIGCAACHELKEDGATVATLRSAKPLTPTRAVAGCLSENVKPGLPNYGLSAAQRKAIVTALRTSEKSTPETIVAATMASFNCYACHERNKMGGVEQPRQKYFQTTQPEMGIEGSIPPGLDGIGAKLTRLWLDNIMANGAKDRPYMHTRMPKFGTANIGHLVNLLEKHDKIKPPPTVELAATTATKTDGWKMIGAKGFSCIKCHTYGKFRATGVQSIDMSIMHKRLREDWFRAYVQNPQLFRRGTRMPSAWPPPPNKSLLPDILDGNSPKQIKAVWLYLSDGPRARTPFGLVTNSLELFATNEAVMYRNFIDGAGPRGIGVAYPELINLAFDANELRLAMIWQGAFIDAKRHWTGRGQGFQGPAGSGVKKFASGADFASLASADTKWPANTARSETHRFRGYQLTKDRRPTFLYEINGFRIEDFPSAIDKGVRPVLVRTIRVSGGERGMKLFFRAASGAATKNADGTYQIDDMKVSIKSKSAPIIRKTELIVPVQDGETITQTIAW